MAKKVSRHLTPLEPYVIPSCSNSTLLPDGITLVIIKCAALTVAGPLPSTVHVANGDTLAVQLAVPLLKAQFKSTPEHATAVAPVPDNPTVCGLAGASSAKDKAAVREPVVDGVKTVVTVQLEPTPKVEPHVVDLEKSDAPEPVMVILERFRVADPTLVRVTIDGELDEPTTMAPKDSDVGENDVLGPVILPTVNVCEALFVAPSTSVAVAWIVWVPLE